MSQIVVEYGTWVEYGNDGRFSLQSLDDAEHPRQQPAGVGWRARHSELSGNDAWGPLASTPSAATIAFLLLCFSRHT